MVPHRGWNPPPRVKPYPLKKSPRPYYKNLGLYYRLALAALHLLGPSPQGLTKGGCVSCEFWQERRSWEKS